LHLPLLDPWLPNSWSNHCTYFIVAWGGIKINIKKGGGKKEKTKGGGRKEKCMLPPSLHTNVVVTKICLYVTVSIKSGLKFPAY